MIRNYLKLAWRNLMKSKVFSLINILGLTIGITVCMMIFLYVLNEYSFDSFHSEKSRIYRVIRSFSDNSDAHGSPYLSGPYQPALLNDFRPEIQRAVRIYPVNGLVTLGDKSFNEKKLYSADADFFTLFSFPLIQGDPATVLKDPQSVVLTETTAKRYFGSVSRAMGKVIMLNKSLYLKVTGIAKDAPFNSHLDFDIVYPIANYASSDFFKVWINNAMYTYVLIAPGVTQQQLQSRMPRFVDKYLGEDMKKFGLHFSLSLEPLPDVYFDNTGQDGVKHGDKKVVYIFLSIAALILLIACINFMNLSTIRAVERSKEVGMRKVMGALRKHLVLQFIGESMLLTAVSAMLALGLLLLLLPFYNHLLGYHLSLSWNKPPVYIFLGGVILIAGLLAGSYPAFMLSAFSPIASLKGKLKLGKGGSLFRQALVVVQFSISVFLILGTIIIKSQMHFVKNKQLGYNKEQTVMVPIDNNDIFNNRDIFKRDLESEKDVANVSMMSGEPGGFFDTHAFQVEEQSGIWQANTEFADFECVQTLGLKIIAGRNFSSQYPTDSARAVLINRTAAQNLGWSPSQAVGKWIRNTVRDDERRTIIGVVEDFNFLSLKQPVTALVISPAIDRRVALIRLKTTDLSAALSAIRKDYSKAAPQYPFEYSFLDQQFDALYKTDLLQEKILGIFSCLAIFIACLGLFGLVSFTAAKRTREIGVRKVLGSSVENIVLLLSKDMLKPVLIATVISLSLGYYAMHIWLQTFAYRTPLHWWIFLLAALITFAIALLTISFRSIQAAMANPASSLRSE